VISASALKPHCGYINVLSKQRQPTPEQQAAIDQGTRFHAAVELWVKGGRLPQVQDLEVQGWLDLLATTWTPSPGVAVEVAWGLSPDGGRVMVEEPEPHVYRSIDGSPLLTAGRVDVYWIDDTGALRVVDWKTGRWPVTAAVDNLQVNAAGIALAAGFRLPAYQPAIYYARDGAWDWGDVVTMGSVAHQAALAAVTAAALLDEKPRPGEWCESCWERRRCPAAPERDETTRAAE
jgi:RecB family exonuclease